MNTIQHEASLSDRLSMYNKNKLKIGLFASNCSSGRAATKVPERWSGSWSDNLALAKMAEEAGIDFLLPIGPLEGVSRRDKLSRRGARNDHMGRCDAREDRKDLRIRYRACPALTSGVCSQAICNDRPDEQWPLRAEYGCWLE